MLVTAESWIPILGILVQNSALHQIWQYLKWKEMHAWQGDIKKQVLEKSEKDKKELKCDGD